MISKKLREAIKLSHLKSYEIAQIAGIHPSTLSKLVCGIELAKPDDRRVIAIGRVLGLSPNECFTTKGRHIADTAR